MQVSSTVESRQNSTAGTTDSRHSPHRYGEVIELRRVRASASVAPAPERIRRL